ncbi:hypothetical protein [Micromonospora profundi]|uniref:hypothetical protein n=1 Tax=Micromonospora TaxID=1873 RepID=UPI0033A99F30
MDLERYLTYGPWVAIVAVGLPVFAKVVVALIVTKGAPPREKAAILRAVGDMFRPWRRGGDRR